jgi:hypothetical protein
MYTFPPVLIKTKELEEVALPSDSEPDTDDARNAVIPRPKRPRSTASRKSSVNYGWLSMQALGQNPSSSITLDVSPHSHSPSKKTALSTTLMKERSTINLKHMSRLPNTTLNVDLRTLNLHLALRAKEVIACSEPMWEWVLECQAEAASRLAQGDSHDLSGSIETHIDGSASKSSLGLTRNVILEMTRDDFDRLLNNFEM